MIQFNTVCLPRNAPATLRAWMARQINGFFGTTSETMQPGAKAMSEKRRRINVRTSGLPRSLLVIDESAKGDVYIRLKSGMQVGIPPDNIAVIQDRMSIHPSPKSEYYTTVKHTLELANGFKQTSVALTDAVKRKRGFTHILTHRSSDLGASVYDSKDDGAETLDLGNFNPKETSLIVGIFVGSPESNFSAVSGNQVVNSFGAGSFQIVICHTWVNLAALPFSWTMKTLTFAPEVCGDTQCREAAYRKMSGESVEGCLELFHGLANELIVNLLETYLSLTADGAVRSSILQSIESVPRIASVRM